MTKKADVYIFTDGTFNYAHTLERDGDKHTPYGTAIVWKTGKRTPKLSCTGLSGTKLVEKSIEFYDLSTRFETIAVVPLELFC